jgi:hypothetical protein
MWKLTSLTLAQPICWGRRFANGTIIGLITILSIAPKSEAMAANVQPSLQQPAANLHSQIIFRIGDRGYTRREEWQYRRDLRMQRRREAERRQYGHMGRYHRDGEHNRDREHNREGQNRRDR